MASLAQFDDHSLYLAIDPVTGAVGDLVGLQLRVAEEDGVTAAKSAKLSLAIMAETLNVVAGHELIIVEISGQKFAIDIMSVREIRGWCASARLPQSPAHVLGMINRRGSVLQVAGFSSRLGVGESDPNTASVVVVAEFGDRLVGLLVDAVCDILTLDDGMLQPPPEVGEPRVHEFMSS